MPQSDAEIQERAKESTSSTKPLDVLKWLISSGLIAAAVAIWATLVGLLYRVGWLSAYKLAPDLFMPESATELTYWAYLAVLAIWADLSDSWFTGFLYLFAYVATFGIAFTLIALGAERFRGWLTKAEERFSTLRQNFWPRLAGGLISVLLPFLGVPVLIFAAASLMVLSPLPGYHFGTQAAEKRIAAYQAAAPRVADSCTVLTGPAGPIGQCPHVIAQTKERIAFLDGTRVHVIASEGISTSWSIKAKPAR